MSNTQKLRRLINATEKYRTISESVHPGTAMSNSAGRSIWWLERKQRPFTQSQALKMKILTTMLRQNQANRQKNINRAHNALIRAQRNVNAVYGPGINANRAATLLKLAHLHAGRTIAKALASSPPILKRAQNKLKARNFIREELSLYRRPNSTVRPSNVKKRRIISK